MPKAIASSIQQATADYETWLAKQIPLLPEDLGLKHRYMAEDPFAFLRATFYRWMQAWPAACPELAGAPAVLAVGDLHVENFGTWRDSEGRLVWGINDFDEAWPLAYTLDLVRLAASALLAIEGGHLKLAGKEAATAALEGYQAALAPRPPQSSGNSRRARIPGYCQFPMDNFKIENASARPFVLAEGHPALWEMARFRLHDPAKFWDKLGSLPTLRDSLPSKVGKALTEMMPAPDLECRYVHRAAGLGSLGRQRYVALADWCGGRIAREAKRLCTSACAWAAGERAARPILYAEVLQQAVRCPDPLVRTWVRPGAKHPKAWLLRRLAPDCSRIELASLPAKRDERRLLHAMGFETGNVHVGAGKTGAIRKDLRRRGDAWLYAAAKVMVEAVLRDWESWRKRAGTS